jgi:hypothetical protein
MSRQQLYLIIAFDANGEDCSQFVAATDAHAAACLWRDYGTGQDLQIAQVEVLDVPTNYMNNSVIEWKHIPTRKVGLCYA